MRKLALTIAVPVLLASASASAHFNLTMPQSSANDMVGGKGPPPCGPDIAEGMVTPVTGGTNLMLNITETVRHGGFYRVALALKSCHTDVAGMPKCFPADNTVYDSGGKVLMVLGPGTSDHADYEMTPVFPVLADNLFPHPQNGTPATPTWTGTVPIPNLSCDKCTLQVIEFMTPHGSNGAAGFFYHHCADLKITADPNKPIVNPNGTGGSGGGGAGGAGGSAGAAGTATGGAGGTGGTGTGTAGTGTAGTATGGTGTSGTNTGGSAVTTGGTATTTGGTATAGSTTLPTAGTGTGTGGAGGTNSTTIIDDSGCGIARRTQGGATALGALGLLFALVRRRRAR